MKLSVAIISHNEEDIIGRCIEAIKEIADEIIVVDSGSTDRTTGIAQSLGAKVFTESWKGFGAQKNSVLEKCSGEWLLFLDCDEIATSELCTAILAAIRTDKADGYFINRRTFYMGKLLKYAWQPDRRLRLVKKSANPRWTDAIVHESLEITGKTALIEGELIHYTYKNFDEQMHRTLKYSRLGAEINAQKNKKAGASDLLLRPAFSFFKNLILKRAILDGIPGIMAAGSIAMGAFTKYAYLWEKKNVNDD